MSEQRSKRMETEDASRADYLLGLLRDVSQRDPSPALRDRLAAVASQRLDQNHGRSTQLLATRQKAVQVWLKPAFAAFLLVVAGLATVFVVHSRRHEQGLSHSTVTVTHSAASAEPDRKALIVTANEPSLGKHHKLRGARHAIAEPAPPRQMTMRLPYSNSAIETGTNTTIRVAMSQSELLSLGFPINATVQDRRIVAELTLGDDGLPRAISLPLPLEVLKEKK